MCIEGLFRTQSCYSVDRVSDEICLYVRHFDHIICLDDAVENVAHRMRMTTNTTRDNVVM